LEAIGPAPRTVDDDLRLGSIVERYGGTFYRNRLSTGKLICAALQTDEADIMDLVRFGRGNRFSLHSLWPERPSHGFTWNEGPERRNRCVNDGGQDAVVFDTC